MICSSQNKKHVSGNGAFGRHDDRDYLLLLAIPRILSVLCTYPSPYPYLAVCRHLLVFPHTHTSDMLTLACGVQGGVCCPPKPSSITATDLPSLVLVMHLRVSHHISGMRNEFVTFCFLFFVQAVRIRQPFLPPAPREIPKGSCIVYVVVHTSGTLMLVFFLGMWTNGLSTTSRFT